MPTAQNGATSKKQLDRLKEQLVIDGERYAPSVENRSIKRAVDMDDVYAKLGKPYSARRIPLSHLEEMRTDAMLAFALLYSKMPEVTARWKIRSPIARLAQAVDEALRPIYGRLALQHGLAKDFGYVGLVKQFKLLERPDWRYISPLTGEPALVWEDAKTPVLVWEPFVPLHPKDIQPRWDDKGKFGGIFVSGSGWTFSTRTARGETGVDQNYVPLENALWITNQRDDQFGSIYGFSQLAYAHKFWWAYELSLAIASRSMERKGDPTVAVYYPPGSSKRNGVMVANSIIAREVGRSIRSGSVVTIPSTPYSDDDDRPTGKDQWRIEFLIGGESFDKLESWLAYLDTMKIRSAAVSDQSLQEGRGGTSSRNVSKDMGERSERLQMISTTEFVSYVNRYVIPQFVERNFPEYRDATCLLEIQDYGSFDQELARILFQGFVNSNPGENPVDMRALAEHMDLPVLSFEAIKAREERLAREAEASRPLPDDTPAGGPAGVTETGFYYDARGLIEMRDNSLLLSLPKTRHFEDAAVLATTRMIRKLHRDRYADIYEDFATYLAKLPGDSVSLADGSQKRADRLKRAQTAARRIVSKWNYSSDLGTKAAARAGTALNTVFSRAGALELKRSGGDQSMWKPGAGAAARWVNDHIGSYIKSVDETVRKELRTFLAQRLLVGGDPQRLAKEVREHFKDFPDWKADRLARTEVRLAYNAGTIFAAEAMGSKVQALDDRLPGHSDEKCRNRNGKIYTPVEALAEDADEHPNGTLAFRILPADSPALSVKVVPLDDERLDGNAAVVEEGQVLLAEGLDSETQDWYLELVARREEITASAAGVS